MDSGSRMATNLNVEVRDGVATHPIQCLCGRPIRKGARMGVVYIGGKGGAGICRECVNLGQAEAVARLRTIAESERWWADRRDDMAAILEQATGWEARPSARGE